MAHYICIIMNSLLNSAGHDSECDDFASILTCTRIDVRLGDRLNGYEAEMNVPLVADIVPWLQKAIAHFYPSSTYAKSLPAEVKSAPRARSSLRQALAHP